MNNFNAAKNTIFHRQHKRLHQRLAISALCLSALSLSTIAPTVLATPDYNPNFFFMVEGKPIGARQWVLGDADNWYLPATQLPARSASGKIQIEAASINKSESLRITFSKSAKYGVWSLNGINGNFAPFKDRAALVFDLQVEKRPESYVNLGLNCGKDCAAQVDIGNLLRKMKRKTLMSLPVALNCFKGDTFDLSKIDGINLNTDTPFVVSIANIRLEALPESEKGCD